MASLRSVEQARHFKNTFGGLDRTGKNGGSEFSEMMNMTSDGFPAVCSRAPRARWNTGNNTGGGVISYVRPFVNNEITAAQTVNGHICFTTKTGLWADGISLSGAALNPAESVRSIIPFGRNIYVVPDGVYAQKNDSGSYSVEKSGCVFSSESALTVSAADENGDAVQEALCDELPQSPSQGDSVILSAGDEAFLYTFSDGGWIKGKRVYPCVECVGIGAGFRTDDRVVFTNLCEQTLKRTFRVLCVREDALITDAPLKALQTKTYFSVMRYFPYLDFAVESNNRIWGCRYGTNIFGDFVNEIYACSPGDPLSWSTFDGISTDSYAASLGCPGVFTGAAVLGGEPVFFKENHIITVSGDIPQNFTVSSLPGRGVERGAHLSIVNLNEKLFYKNAVGIMVYDGAFARCISEKLGPGRFTSGAAGTADGKYRIVLTDEQGSRAQYVYDTAKGMWHVEDDDERAKFFVYLNNCLYSVCLFSSVTAGTVTVNTYVFDIHDASAAVNGVNIFTDGESDDFVYIPESTFEFMAETGDFAVENGSEAVRRIVLRAEKDEEAVLKTEIMCGGDADWRELCCTDRKIKGSFSIPVNTPRCTSFRLRFSGTGQVKIRSVSVITEKTSEVNMFGN